MRRLPLPLLFLALLGACETSGAIGVVECADPTRSQLATVAEVAALQDQIDALADLQGLTDTMSPCVVDPTLDCVSDRQLAAEVVLLQSETQYQSVRIDELERDIASLLEEVP